MLRQLLNKVKGLLNKFSSNSGFTLIELLIVIVIIGILAGVMLAIIDPAAQQNRARDANVRADLNKMGLAIGSFLSANGVIPTDTEVLTTMTGASPYLATCGQVSPAHMCWFSLDNSALPANKCTVPGATPASHYLAGATQCYFLYVGGSSAAQTAFTEADDALATSTYFRLVARAYGSDNTYVYANQFGKMYRCSLAIDLCTAF